jgi:hypothetical protein
MDGRQAGVHHPWCDMPMPILPRFAYPLKNNAITLGFTLRVDQYSRCYHKWK